MSQLCLNPRGYAGPGGEGEADVGQGQRGGDTGRAQQRGDHRAPGPQVSIFSLFFTLQFLREWFGL